MPSLNWWSRRCAADLVGPTAHLLFSWQTHALLINSAAMPLAIDRERCSGSALETRDRIANLLRFYLEAVAAAGTAPLEKLRT